MIVLFLSLMRSMKWKHRANRSSTVTCPFSSSILTQWLQLVGDCSYWLFINQIESEANLGRSSTSAQVPQLPFRNLQVGQKHHFLSSSRHCEIYLTLSCSLCIDPRLQLENFLLTKVLSTIGTSVSTRNSLRINFQHKNNRACIIWCAFNARTKAHHN